jgi:hypothetical protein
VEPAKSTTAAIDIVSNPDVTRCPDECFRPVGLAWDGKGRLFMTSDSTGEIYVVVRADGGSTDDANPSTGLPSAPSGTGTAPQTTKSPGAAVMNMGVSQFAVALAVVLALPWA